MKYKYALHPGEVVSKMDSQTHFVSALELARLYGVKITECVVCRVDHPQYGTGNDDLIHLYPRYKGDYPNYGDA